MKKVLYVITLILLLIFSFIFFTYEHLTYYEKILSSVTEEFNINSYSIFGTHLNIEGCINKKLDNANLILKNKEEEIFINSTFYEDNGNTCFYISRNNNDSIYLEDLKIGDYLLLVKNMTNNEIEYYTLKNNTEYDDIEYYTITKNNSNNKINIDFNVYKDINYVRFTIKESKLPQNVVDISIDPGHGGKDPGAIGILDSKEYYESNLTLNISLLLKEQLEKTGLKVNITRSDDKYLEPYGEGGRALIANDTKAKYSFSIHFNSDYGTMKYGGVEIYTPNDIDLTLATKLADSLSNVVGYSKNPNFKLKDGVYYKYFRQTDIDESNKSMIENDFEPYTITLNCPYMYMIRELGGINTYAYVDGRNDYYGLNSHYNSNHTTEPYLLELGYINYLSDLYKAINNPELFSDAISNAIKEYLKI